MRIASRLIARAFKFPPAETYKLEIKRDIAVPMPDGAILLGDLISPKGAGKLPTILYRTPYGRYSMTTKAAGLGFFAERGYHVFVQSCRGTDGSGGSFDAFRQEDSDGVATTQWLKQQLWYSGGYAMIGSSYNGYVQWAITHHGDPDLKAIFPIETATDLPAFWYEGGGFKLEPSVHWLSLMVKDKGFVGFAALFRTLLNMGLGRDPLSNAWNQLPLKRLDRELIGDTVPWFQAWLENSPNDGNGWWDNAMHHHKIAGIQCPAYLLAGWHDIFINNQIADFEALQAAGKKAFLTVGPWGHSMYKDLFDIQCNDAFSFFDANLKEDGMPFSRQAVRLYVMGAEEWKYYDEWPVKVGADETWYLCADASLSRAVPIDNAPPRQYSYDPAEPTPAVGGNRLPLPSQHKYDNTELEHRNDVLLYDTPIFDCDYEVIGNPIVTLLIKSSCENTDFFVRICDVSDGNKSHIVTDGYIRLKPGAPTSDEHGVREVIISMSPTAYQFKKGHKLRFVVASGAHPNHMRNLGTDEPFSSATKLVSADQSVFNDTLRASRFVVRADRKHG